MALRPNSWRFSGKAFDVVSALVMIRLFIGFSLGLPPAKAINDPFISNKALYGELEDNPAKMKQFVLTGDALHPMTPDIGQDRKIGAFDVAGDGRGAVEAAEFVEEGGLEGKCEGGGDLCYPQEHVVGGKEAATATDRAANEEMPNLRSKIEEMEREKAESKRRVEELEEMIGFMSRRGGCEFEEEEDQFGGCGLWKFGSVEVWKFEEVPISTGEWRF
ncbi:hypothetical protein Pint_33725 [Pistacia integerrima]|uniref:Uncharacterized protein n=1 Tax=Pistacia integerrima TaxID=434235 RepID=A0ACC0X8Z3_9ROSI|nr:hypothetical protein Pint_33725 [Pistacia integerrima]